MTPKRGCGRPPESAEYPVRFLVQVSADMRVALRARALTCRKTMAQVVRDAISAHLKRRAKV